MRVFSRKTLVEIWTKHVDAEQSLKSWFSEAEKARWKTPADIKRLYPSASFLVDNRVVFSIKGNTYRLIVKINYDYGQVFVRFIGTHAQYDKIDAPNPVEAVKFRMEQLGLSQRDLARLVGSRSRASEILSGKRTMSLRVIRVLNQKLNIPAEVLLQQEESVT